MAAYDQKNAYRKEVLRAELINTERRSAEKSLRNLDMYSSGMRRSAPPTPLDRSRIATDWRVQDWASPSGTRKSAPNNVPETSAVVNNNELRFKRDGGFANTLPFDGGALYGPETCLNNWVEERRDRTYAPTFMPKDLKRTNVYGTEYTVSYAPKDEEYRNRIMSIYNSTARFSGLARPVTVNSTGRLTSAPAGGTATSTTFRSTIGSSTGTSGRGDNVFYAREGFGPTNWQDHTSASKRGSFWVGTAPVSGESVSHTAHRVPAGELEFTRKCPTEDAKQKILLCAKSLIDESPQVERVRTTLLQSQKHASTWRTMYSTEFKNHNVAPSS